MATKLAKIVADFRTSLASSIAIGGTTATLQSITDDDGNTIANGTYFFTLDGDSSKKEHIVCTVTGTALSSIKTITRQGVQSAGVARAHRIGASVVITDFAHIKYLNDLLDGTTNLNASTPLKYDGTATISHADHLATKAYADALAIAGAPDADTATKGIIEIATAAERAAGTATGGTGAVLVPSNDSLVKTSSGAGDENKIPVLNASGQLAQGFVVDSSATVAGKTELATDAELAAGTASGGAGPLVAGGASFKTTTSATISNDVNKVPVAGSTGVLDSHWTNGVGTSGESFSIGDGLYLKASDGKLYKSLGSGNESTFSFVGIAQTTVAAADLSARFARPGQIAYGLAGLTAGSYYYVTDVAGTLGTTPGTNFAKVGQAMSTTTMRVIEPKFVARGSFDVSASGNTSVTTGFYPARILLNAALASGSNLAAISWGDDSNNCVFLRNNSADVTSNQSGSNAINVVNTVNQALGTVSAKSATGFTVNIATYGAGTTTVKWTAFSE